MSPINRSAPSRSGPTRRPSLGLAAVLVAGLALTACAPPGSPAPSSTSTDSGDGVSTELPAEPLTLQVMTSAEAAEAVTKLGEEFTRQHPTVTFDIVADANQNLTTNMSRILTRDDPPALVFMPGVAQPAQDGLLANLDPYAEAYGWDAWSQTLLDMARMTPDGKRGEGSLYAVGIGYNVTGVFYNKVIAEQLGITEPPATLDEFEADALKAVEAGLMGISLAAKDAGTPFLLQELQNSYGDAPAINDWIHEAPGATFDQPGMLAAATKLQEWTRNGIISEDAVSVDYPTMMADFQAGKALFVPNGDWEAQRIVAAMGNDVGFFLMPPATAGDDVYAMAAPTNYSIPAASTQKDAAAYFLNWVHTDEAARKLIVDLIGASPGGPVDMPPPETDVPLVQETTEAFQSVLSSDGAVDFIANAAPAFTLSTLNPAMQALVLGSDSPQQFIEKVQAGYEAELAG